MPGIPTAMEAAALALCAAGPLLLRHGWQRSKAVVGAAWTILAVAAAILANDGGAWGLAAGATVAMAVALVLLTQAAAFAPAPRGGGAERIAAPQPRLLVDWPDVARRSAVFLIVVVFDLAASLLLAWSVQRAMFRAGADAADATAVGLFLLPLVWLAMASWQMTRTRPGPMMLAPLCAGLLGGIAWLTT